MLAQQALTVQAAVERAVQSGHRPSHAPVVEGMWGLSYERPAVHMREYLSVLLPLDQRRAGQLQRGILPRKRRRAGADAQAAAGADRRAGARDAAHGRRDDGRHDHLDGRPEGARQSHRSAHHEGSERCGPARASHRGRPTDRCVATIRHGARERAASSFRDLRHAAKLQARARHRGCGRTGGGRDRWERERGGAAAARPRFCGRHGLPGAGCSRLEMTHRLRWGERGRCSKGSSGSCDWCTLDGNQLSRDPAPTSPICRRRNSMSTWRALSRPATHGGVHLSVGATHLTCIHPTSMTSSICSAGSGPR